MSNMETVIYFGDGLGVELYSKGYRLKIFRMNSNEIKEKEIYFRALGINCCYVYDFYDFWYAVGELSNTITEDCGMSGDTLLVCVDKDITLYTNAENVFIAELLLESGVVACKEVDEFGDSLVVEMNDLVYNGDSVSKIPIPTFEIESMFTLHKDGVLVEGYQGTDESFIDVCIVTIFGEIKTFIKSATNITKQEIKIVNNVADNAIWVLDCEKLKELRIDLCVDREYDIGENQRIFDRCPNLKTLRLSSYIVNNDISDLVGDYMGQLKTIVLGRNIVLSDDAIKRIKELGITIEIEEDNYSDVGSNL